MWKIRKYLRAQRNGTSFSHIHVRFHHEFNEWTPQEMWAEGEPFSML